MATEDPKIQAEYERLRSFLNPAIKGTNTDSILYSIASATEPGLIQNVSAVNDSMYIISANEKYLDQRLADYNLARPPEVGIDDDTFREIGIAVINKKQVRSLIEKILTIMFGAESTQASAKSSIAQPYALEDGDSLLVSFDGADAVTVRFQTSEFADISNATAEEVADAISKSLKAQGSSGAAFAENDGISTYVYIRSSTEGPQSTVRVYGGRAQNVLKFPQIRSVSGTAATQWTIASIAGSTTRFTWTGGDDPTIGKARVGDYVNVYGVNFLSSNRGTFNITAVQGGLVGNAYFEVENPNGTSQTVLQGSLDGLLVFNPQKQTITSNFRWAAAFQTSARLLEVFIPATTRVVRRGRIGSAHLRDPLTEGPESANDYGPYIFDTTQPFVISSIGSTLSSAIDASTGRLIPITNASNFPDASGQIILGYGTSRQEGPIPYIARPSSGSILLNPSYIIKQAHPINEDVSFVAKNGPVSPAQDGSDYQFFITDVVSGRTYAEELINSVAATGINIVFTIIYPSDTGLGKGGTQYSDKFYVWGS